MPSRGWAYGSTPPALAEGAAPGPPHRPWLKCKRRAAVQAAALPTSSAVRSRSHCLASCSASALGSGRQPRAASPSRFLGRMGD